MAGADRSISSGILIDVITYKPTILSGTILVPDIHDMSPFSEEARLLSGKIYGYKERDYNPYSY